MRRGAVLRVAILTASLQPFKIGASAGGRRSSTILVARRRRRVEVRSEGGRAKPGPAPHHTS